MQKLCFILGILADAGAFALRAANPGDEVVIVYNERLPESRALANYYAQQRQVPASQIFGFDLSTSEEISRKDFQDSLQKPLARALEDKKLWHIGSQPGRLMTNRHSASPATPAPVREV